MGHHYGVEIAAARPVPDRGRDRQVDGSAETVCIRLTGADGRRMAEALDECRRANPNCPLRDLEIEELEEAVQVTLRPDDPAAFRRIGVERCLRIVEDKVSGD